ncbi:hypothetical protein [Jeotgalibacillus proteolyticus]|uniref:Uncharacterized protein n=1 Tax=Jeotgalibacillus proteolyticus TaxID=2082395 RepID=A0A2S5GH29_9BACL|nr:hypothetical protein [Jeotgalibacillus proteolyticus]PPA72289.1 hypothetical protein C4B60_02625 [Jeotgalibacillus proteolyticus]
MLRKRWVCIIFLILSTSTVSWISHEDSSKKHFNAGLPVSFQSFSDGDNEPPLHKGYLFYDLNTQWLFIISALVCRKIRTPDWYYHHLFSFLYPVYFQSLFVDFSLRAVLLKSHPERGLKYVLA